MRGLLARALTYLYAQTFNATGYGSYAVGRAVTPPKPLKGTMPTEHLARLLNEFQSRYGRLCLLTCQALANGADTAMIHKAFNGDTFSHATKIVEAYRASDIALKACNDAGAPTSAITNAAFDVRTAIEGEWMVEIDGRIGVGH